MLQLVRVGSKMCLVVRGKAGMSWKLQDLAAKRTPLPSPAARGRGSGVAVCCTGKRVRGLARGGKAQPSRRVFSLVLAKAVSDSGWSAALFWWRRSCVTVVR